MGFLNKDLSFPSSQYAYTKKNSETIDDLKLAFTFQKCLWMQFFKHMLNGYEYLQRYNDTIRCDESFSGIFLNQLFMICF